MFTFFAALCQKVANSSSLKLSIPAIFDDTETVGAELQIYNVENIKKYQSHQSPEYTVSMLTFFAALC
jgi:hypothetical protein